MSLYQNFKWFFWFMAIIGQCPFYPSKNKFRYFTFLRFISSMLLALTFLSFGNTILLLIVNYNEKSTKPSGEFTISTCIQINAFIHTIFSLASVHHKPKYIIDSLNSFFNNEFMKNFKFHNVKKFKRLLHLFLLHNLWIYYNSIYFTSVNMFLQQFAATSSQIFITYCYIMTLLYSRINSTIQTSLNPERIYRLRCFESDIKDFIEYLEVYFGPTHLSMMIGLFFSLLSAELNVVGLRMDHSIAFLITVFCGTLIFPMFLTYCCRQTAFEVCPVQFIELYSVRGLERSELGGSHGCPGRLWDRFL